MKIKNIIITTITVLLFSFTLINASFAQQLTANAGPDTTICFEKIIQIGGTPTASGGTAPYTYTWCPATGLPSTNTPNPFASPYNTTTYTVTVTDSLGATATDFVVINISPLPVADAGSGVTICAGDSVVLNASGGMYYTWSSSSTLSNLNIQNPMAFPSTTTTYTVTVTDVYGCLATDNVIVTTSPVAAFIMYPDTVVQHHYYVTNNASGVLPLTFLWNWGDGTYDTIAYPTHTYNAAGFYTFCLSVTDGLGCSNTYCDSSYLQKSPNSIISIEVISQLTTYIDFNELSKVIKIYPNPATNNISIESPQKAEIEILSIQGQTILQNQIQQGKTEIDISGLAKGVYILKLSSNDKTEVKRIVKE